MKHYILNLWFLNINRSLSEWICPKCQKKRRLRLRYDNVFKTAWTDEFHFIKHSRKGNKFAFCEFYRTATECTILRPSEKKFIFSWFYHTIFKVLTTQILYPKCSRMQHFASFWTWKIRPSPTAFSLSRVGMYAFTWNLRWVYR